MHKGVSSTVIDSDSFPERKSLNLIVFAVDLNNSIGISCMTLLLSESDCSLQFEWRYFPFNKCTELSLENYALMDMFKVQKAIEAVIHYATILVLSSLFRRHRHTSIIFNKHRLYKDIWAATRYKPTKWHVHAEKTQINLGIRSAWSEFLLRAYRVDWGIRYVHAHD